MSIEYYEENHEAYINETFDTDMSFIYKEFEKYLPLGSILDLGCGSGRDSLYFTNKGYDVVSVDGSLAMVNYCNKLLSSPVIHASFEDFTYNMSFDGIWANASLLHVPKDQLRNIIIKYLNMLSDHGIFYLSFKEGPEDYVESGRLFTCFMPEDLDQLLRSIDDCHVIEIIRTNDVRDYRDDDHWISAIIQRN